LDDRDAKVMLGVRVNRFGVIVFLSSTVFLACQGARRENTMLNHEQMEDAIADLRAAYAAFNRGDIDAAVRSFDPQVEWIEPTEFPGGGTYQGVEGAKRYLAQSRAGASQVISEPEQFVPAGDRIVVFVHARVLPKNSGEWQDIRLADVYRFRKGRVIQMHAFANREDALHWVGVSQPGSK
jgi:ketosteroid isomerase-like protein